MRSCFPEFVIPKRRSAAVGMVADDSGLDDPGRWLGGLSQSSTPSVPEHEEASGFQDIELFLAEYDLTDNSITDETYDENEIAEVLATTWRDKRQELNRLNKARKFHQAGELRRSFRVEIEELKKRTKCRNCGKTGHWARECRSKKTTPPPSTDFKNGVSYVESFVGMVGVKQSMLEQLRLRRQSPEIEIALVSSPGFAVLDSGCGKTIIGRQTFEEFRRIWDGYQVSQPEEVQEVNHFRFGNGQSEKSCSAINMPVAFGGRTGNVHACIVNGSAPLLLSRPAMKKLRAVIDFDKDNFSMLDGEVTIPIQTNEAGQYVVNVTCFDNNRDPGQANHEPFTLHSRDEQRDSSAAVSSILPSGDDVAASPAPSNDHSVNVTVVGPRGKKKDFWELDQQNRLVIRHHVQPRKQRFTPCHTRCPILPEALSVERVTRIVENNHVVSEVCDNWTVPDNAHSTHRPQPWIGSTVFSIDPSTPLPSDCNEALLTQWTTKQARQVVESMITKQAPKLGLGQRFNVVEVFSPPRFALQAATQGLKCLSADLITKWDFRLPKHPQAMKDLITRYPPELLVLCPPCTWAGGWFHLNKYFMDPSELAEKQRLTTLFVNFCCELIEIQLKSNGRVLFEHPQGSSVWSMPSVKSLLDRTHLVDLDLCCFGLKIPNGLLIKKSTRLLVSHADMKVLAKKCPGSSHVDHCQHQLIAGSHPAVGSVSKHAGCYPVGFVRAVMRTVREFPKPEVLVVNPLQEHECFVAGRVRELNAANGQKLQEALRKLHTNLGHPGNQNLVRILKHGGASPEAIEAARSFKCQQCEATAHPRPPLPAKPDRVTNFNQRIGVDVKYLRGWAVNQKIPAINIVDYASSFQIMVPIFKKETSEQIRQVIQDRWISWAGTPDEIVMDPAKPNIREALVRPTELSGSIVHITAADAHHQLGKVEVHGGWFGHVLDRILQEQSPANAAQWMECVHAAHCKNELIQVYGHTPSQFVFGRNPKIPENLLDEPLEVVPATASLMEESYARRVAVRQAARRAVVELQDSKALRLALAARPRHQPEFVPGSYVAYWRSQKWQQGTLDNQGRWHGPAIVLGKIGRNLIVCHKKQLLRVAPEQLRMATQEEKVLLRAPHAELLGVKQLFESGELPSNQYVDLAPQAYPTIADSEPAAAPAANPPAALPFVPPAEAEAFQVHSDANVGPVSIAERAAVTEPEPVASPMPRRSEPYPENSSLPVGSSGSTGDTSHPMDQFVVDYFKRVVLLHCFGQQHWHRMIFPN